MKKKTKKLVLAKETVRSLEEEVKLDEVKGGACNSLAAAGSCLTTTC
ncbi:MAG TPA: class I lanthipeptide [Thermoanaerobaculia bacterium]|nr:class I lanthipeptide [Thermoanaerobaculia bacterium]